MFNWPQGSPRPVGTANKVRLLLILKEFINIKDEIIKKLPKIIKKLPKINYYKSCQILNFKPIGHH